MFNYKNGKIYKIVCNETGETYYGSTISSLKQRLSKHKCQKNTQSKHIIDRGNYEILLVENVPCDSKDELLNREKFYIENNECLNLKVPQKDIKITKAEHYLKNKEHVNAKCKEWYEKNKDKVSERNKERAEERSVVYKAWREANHDKVLERGREKIQCECGAWICRSGMARHKKRH